MKLYPIFLKEIKKKYILKAQDLKSQNNYAQLNFGEKSIFIPLVIFIQQNIDYSIFNLLFIRIIIESVSSRTKNINALNCFFYINQELLDNIGVEGTQILAPRSIVNVVECLRFYSKNMRNLQYRYETGGEEIPMTFRINIERLSMPSIFLNILGDMKGDNMEIEKLLKDNREYSLDVLVGLKEKPWEYEPNYYKFWHKNLPCWIKRMARGGGQLNGYTGIPIVQKIMNTNIINTNGEFEYFDYKIHEDNECIYDLFNQNIRVHGGLTYSNFKEGYLILGFDTGHDGDYCPYLDELIKNTSTYIPSIPPLKSLRRSKATYKTFRYVYENCTALADQLYNLLGLNKIEKYYSRFYDELKLNYKYMDFGLFCRESGEINIL